MFLLFDFNRVCNAIKNTDQIIKIKINLFTVVEQKYVMTIVNIPKYTINKQRKSMLTNNRP